jgi:hypothetical protein
MRFSKYPGVQKAIDNGDIPQVLRLDIRSREAYSDMLVYTWDNEDFSVSERKKMRKEGDWSFVNRGLFQKVKQGDGYLTVKDAFGNPQHVYKMINAWGDSFRANEFYTLGKKSVIDNGFLKVDEVSDDVILEHFPSIFKEKVVSSQPKRTGSTVTKTISTAPIVSTTISISSEDESTKTPIEGLNERLDSYGNTKLVFSSDFYEGERPKGKLSGFKSLLAKLRENIVVLADVNWNNFDFFLSKEDIDKLNALKLL